MEKYRHLTAEKICEMFDTIDNYIDYMRSRKALLEDDLSRFQNMQDTGEVCTRAVYNMTQQNTKLHQAMNAFETEFVVTLGTQIDELKARIEHCKTLLP